MRVLVCGDREWKCREKIFSTLSQIKRSTTTQVTVIHGDCRGADRIAGQVAEELQMAIEVYPADWDTHGKAAGPIRNQQMLDDGKPDLVIAFHPNISASKGTKDMLKRAREAGVSTMLVSQEAME